MKVLIHSSSVSPHQAPLALEVSHLLPEGEILMLYTSTPSDPFRATGVHDTVKHIVRKWEGSEQDYQQLLSADMVMENHRNFEWLERRIATGKIVLHPSERWFKPEKTPFFNWYVPGFWKMLLPFALKRAVRMHGLLKNSPNMYYLPMGIHAARDMARMCGLLNGDIRCLFRSPRLKYENEPGGRIWAEDGKDSCYCLDRMRMWGYFVAPSSRPSTSNPQPSTLDEPLRILWVGRFLRWKKVDTIIKAIRGLPRVELDLIGSGPDENRLRKCAKGDANVHFWGSVPLSQVRELMHSHDMYVLSSSAYEGWGAVINEALEEGMRVIGTYEAGSSGTILPPSNLFHAGDWKALRRLIISNVPNVKIGAWGVSYAAQKLINWR